MNTEQFIEQYKARTEQFKARIAEIMASSKTKEERLRRLEELDREYGGSLYPYEREAFNAWIRDIALLRGAEEAERWRRAGRGPFTHHRWRRRRPKRR